MIKIATPKGNYTQTDVNISGRCEKIPSQKEMVKAYFAALQFFREREKYYNDAASWYFKESRTDKAKAIQHLHKANLARQNASEYLDLIGVAYVNGFCFHPQKRGISDVA